MSDVSNKYQHVKYLWDDSYVQKLSPLEALIYRSNILGADQRLSLIHI
mgnify:FL=1